MTVYVTAQLTIRDRTAYAAYEAGFMGVFRKFGGTMLAVDEKPTVLERRMDRHAVRADQLPG